MDNRKKVSKNRILQPCGHCGPFHYFCLVCSAFSPFLRHHNHSVAIGKRSEMGYKLYDKNLEGGVRLGFDDCRTSDTVSVVCILRWEDSGHKMKTKRIKYVKICLSRSFYYGKIVKFAKKTTNETHFLMLINVGSSGSHQSKKTQWSCKTDCIHLGVFLYNLSWFMIK